MVFFSRAAVFITASPDGGGGSAKGKRKIYAKNYKSAGCKICFLQRNQKEEKNKYVTSSDESFVFKHKKGSQVLLFLYHHEEFSSFSLHLWEKEAAAAARSNNLLFRGHVLIIQRVF